MPTRAAYSLSWFTYHSHLGHPRRNCCFRSRTGNFGRCVVVTATVPIHTVHKLKLASSTAIGGCESPSIKLKVPCDGLHSYPAACRKWPPRCLVVSPIRGPSRSSVRFQDRINLKTRWVRFRFSCCYRDNVSFSFSPCRRTHQRKGLRR